MPDLSRSSAALLICLLASCGPRADYELPGEVQALSKEYSAEEKAVAASLSIGAVRTLDEEMSAYTVALTCSLALDAIRERLSESQIGQAQIGAIDRAREIYSDRARQQATLEAKSEAQVNQDRAAREEEIPNLVERGQVAVGCLRQLIS